MINRSIPCLLIALVSAVACHPVNTVPRPVSPTAAIQYYDLEIPSDLEIRSVDFSATTFSEVSGAGGYTSSETGGRAFVKVYAVRRTTGEQFLLLYEDIEHRKRPARIIRFVPSVEKVHADSTH
ncbi:MAG TPA: hypothetical protein VNX15_03880 [Gemmatimonadales bacterium]|jgi:hypothetical protein|nr:hypothetical protein [Gemmatimonadales bacterium]